MTTTHPKRLTADLLPAGGDVLTVTTWERVQMRDGTTGEVETVLFVGFHEFPGYELKCNRVQQAAFRRLMDAGKIAESPIGCRVPLEPYRVVYRGVATVKLRPVLPEEFDAKLAARS